MSEYTFIFGVSLFLAAFLFAVVIMQLPKLSIRLLTGLRFYKTGVLKVKKISTMSAAGGSTYQSIYYYRKSNSGNIKTESAWVALYLFLISLLVCGLFGGLIYYLFRF